MVKAYRQEHVYKHPWERVSAASWRKFADPENKRILSHILEVDTLNRKLDTETGKLHTTRALTIHAPGPWFLHRIIGQDICHCVESTVVDGKSRSMQVSSAFLYALIGIEYLLVDTRRKQPLMSDYISLYSNQGFVLVRSCLICKIRNLF